MTKPEEHPDHPHGGPPGQTGDHPDHPHGGPPGQNKPEEPEPEEPPVADQSLPEGEAGP
jgi:hypothetical protein